MRRQFWTGFPQLLLCVVLLCQEAAAFSSARLVYSRERGAETCGNEALLRKAVTERLGYDPFFPTADKTIVARISREPSGLRGTVELIDSQGVVRGQRELHAPATLCSELLSGMALAISIVIDPSSVDPAQRRRAGNAPGAEPAPPLKGAAQATPLADPAKTPVSDRGLVDPALSPGDSRWIPELELGIAVSSGLAPSMGVGPTALFGLRRAWWSGAAELRYQFIQDRAASSGVLSSSLAEAALFGCGHISLVFLCAEISGGSLRVSGERVLRPNTETTLVWKTGARLGVEFRASEAVGARAHTDLLFNLGSQAVDLDGRREWTSPPVALLGGAALYGRFP